MNATATTTASIDSKNDFFAQVRDTGVLVDGGDKLLRAEGEGRGTRYFVDDEKVMKADIEAELEAIRGDDGSIEVHIPVAGPVQKDDEPESGKVECRYCGDTLGYLTGSHMKSHDDDGPQSVDEYRQFVAERRDIKPDEVPLCTDDMMEKFEEAGNLDEETTDRLSKRNRARWRAGEYDHLRKDDADNGSADA